MVELKQLISELEIQSKQSDQKIDALSTQRVNSKDLF